MPFIRPGVVPTVDFMVLAAGQSLALDLPLYDSDAAIKRVLHAEASHVWPALAVSATGGSSVLKKYRRTDIANLFWYDEDTASAGPLLTSAVTYIGTLSRAPDALVWLQGEQDADAVANGGDFTTADKTVYKQGLAFIIDALRDAVGASVPVVIGILGRREAAGSAVGWRRVREAHLELAGSTVGAVTCERYDIALRDSVHYGDEGGRDLGARIARAIQGEVGPELGVVSASGNVLSLPITDTNGRGLIKPATPAGFRFMSGATEVQPLGWTWSGDTAQATFAASPVGLTVQYIHERGAGLDTAAVIREATGGWPANVVAQGLPLQWFPAFTV